MMEALWEALLRLQEGLSRVPAKVQWLSFCYGAEPVQWAIDTNVHPQAGQQLVQVYWEKGPDSLIPDAHHVRIENIFTARLESTLPVSSEIRRLLESYLPYCLLPVYAHQKQRAISITHFAQSLDGRIATESGDSRWIGSQDNLIHAHRMRALCDGILIGAQTLVSDEPALTVRHVPGSNPRRIVVGSSASDFSSLWRSCADPVLVLGNGRLVEDERLEYVCREQTQGRWQGEEILRCLYERGICSVYIEGGAQTTSYFLQDQAVDILQLHLSPRLFGSGVSAIRLPAISEVQEAVEFEPFTFLPVGNSMMFVGQIREKS